MKVVMINDCAFVGETILKHLPPDVDKQHLKRSRGLWSKTLGLSYKILEAKGDVYHAHYLLQDCYVTSRLGKHPLIGHAHGTDLRESLKHPIWRRIVRHNLKHCDKILVSTPDLLPIAKAAGADADYFPNPVDAEIFYPRPLIRHGGKMRLLIASSAWFAKGTDLAIRALSQLKDRVEVSIVKYGPDYNSMLTLAESLGLPLNSLPMLPHEQARQHYWKADLVIDQFRCGVVGNVFLEAVACGRPALGYVSSAYPELRALPLKDIDSTEKIVDAIAGIGDLDSLWRTQHAYVKANHDMGVIADRALRFYTQLALP